MKTFIMKASRFYMSISTILSNVHNINKEIFSTFENAYNLKIKESTLVLSQIKTLNLIASIISNGDITQQRRYDAD